LQVKILQSLLAQLGRLAVYQKVSVRLCIAKAGLFVGTTLRNSVPMSFSFIDPLS
jgi:hypothetical protein